MEHKEYSEKNRAAWNQVAPVHRKGRKIDLHTAVQDPAFNTLDEVALRVLGEIGIEGKHIAHLCCNNGRELISALRMGGGRSTGFDISDAFIEEARELAALAQVECEFVRTDVFEIPPEHDGRYDLVWFTIGAFTWIKDLDALFAVCRRLLKPGGVLFVYEMHPFLDMMAGLGDPEYCAEDELKIAFPYFSEQPWVSNEGLDYIGDTVYESSESVSFPHTLSEILGGVTNNGFVITGFREYPHDISEVFAHLEKYNKIPMCYTLVGKKQ